MAEVFCILSTGRTILHGSEAAVPSTESTRATFGTYLFSFPDGTDWILLGSGSIHQNINPRDLQGNHKDRRIVSEGCKGVTVVLLVQIHPYFHCSENTNQKMFGSVIWVPKISIRFPH